MLTTEHIGDIAAFIGVSSSIPLIHRVYKEKNTHALSYVWLAMEMVAQVLWFYYGYKTGSTPIRIGAVLSFITTTILIGLKIRNES